MSEPKREPKVGDLWDMGGSIILLYAADVDIGLGGDVTAKSRNIGYDWTVYLKLASSF